MSSFIVSVSFIIFWNVFLLFGEVVLPLRNWNLFPAGATVPKKEVIDVIKKFNIQVNNLTQVGLYMRLQFL